MNKRTFHKPVVQIGKFLMAGALAFPLISQGAWQSASGPLQTRWAKDVSPAKAHPEYPRPQMMRKDWLNLNGLWELTITNKEAPKPDSFQTQILVPFPVESALSGVMKPVGENDQLWYRRTFEIPLKWIGKLVLLHFDAVDFDARVWVNGKQLGQHRGGYDGFSFDITGALNPDGLNELVVAVSDPTDAGTQPRGKQVRKPHSIWYTSTSGIWQTVWLEPVNAAYIKSIEITPDVDHNAVTVHALTTATLGHFTVEMSVREGFREIYAASISPGGTVTMPIKNARLWSPEDPHLYTLRVSLRLGGRAIDKVESYFGMRKISLGKDDKGFTRILLNNKPYFQFGPLDQGFWPDGLYTAPTDAALRYDIEMTKKLGFNLARKHVKVEPDRWYYWCDKLGLLVWQDMPSGNNATPAGQREFEAELLHMVKDLYNHPAVIVWVLFNEGWGQYDTQRLAQRLKSLDPSRLVDNASGWTDMQAGDIVDLHNYPGPAAPRPEAHRGGVLGEFGGLGLIIEGHSWSPNRHWGYRMEPDSKTLADSYSRLIKQIGNLHEIHGLSAAVLT